MTVKTLTLKALAFALGLTAFTTLIVACGSAGDDTSSASSEAITEVIETTVAELATDDTDPDGATTAPASADNADITETTLGAETSGSDSNSDPTGDQPSQIEFFFNVDDPDECGAVDGNPRTVPAGVDAARFAFDQLVAGPTAAEISDGVFSFFNVEMAQMVRSVTRDGGRLIVDFADFRPILGPEGATTSCGSAALLGQLNATAFQFDDVDAVRYEFAGSCDDFGQWLQGDCVEIDRSEWEAAVGNQLPGQPFDGMLTAGAVLGVVGVQIDDVLNVRALPGASQDIVATVEPLTTGLTFTGRERLGDPTGIWYEIDTGSQVGWVNAWFVSPLAGGVDVTTEVVSVVGEIPSAETGAEVADIVIDARLRNIDADPTVVLVDGPHSGDDQLSEITFDVLGFYDDAVRGERLHMFFSASETADGPMTLTSVEATTICARGDGTSELCP